jgi:hypothetical protein
MRDDTADIVGPQPQGSATDVLQEFHANGAVRFIFRPSSLLPSVVAVSAIAA